MISWHENGQDANVDVVVNVFLDVLNFALCLHSQRLKYWKWVDLKGYCIFNIWMCCPVMTNAKSSVLRLAGITFFLVFVWRFPLVMTSTTIIFFGCMFPHLVPSFFELISISLVVPLYGRNQVPWWNNLKILFY